MPSHLAYLLLGFVLGLVLARVVGLAARRCPWCERDGKEKEQEHG